MDTLTVPITDARARFADLIATARTGGVVTLTNHGTPVAVVTSPTHHDTATVSAIGDALTAAAEHGADLRAIAAVITGTAWDTGTLTAAITAGMLSDDGYDIVGAVAAWTGAGYVHLGDLLAAWTACPEGFNSPDFVTTNEGSPVAPGMTPEQMAAWCTLAPALQPTPYGEADDCDDVFSDVVRTGADLPALAKLATLITDAASAADVYEPTRVPRAVLRWVIEHGVTPRVATREVAQLLAAGTAVGDLAAILPTMLGDTRAPAHLRAIPGGTGSYLALVSHGVPRDVADTLVTTLHQLTPHKPKPGYRPDFPIEDIIDLWNTVGNTGWVIAAHRAGLSACYAAWFLAWDLPVDQWNTPAVTALSALLRHNESRMDILGAAVHAARITGTDAVAAATWLATASGAADPDRLRWLLGLREAGVPALHVHRWEMVDHNPPTRSWIGVAPTNTPWASLLTGDDRDTLMAARVPLALAKQAVHAMTGTDSFYRWATRKQRGGSRGRVRVTGCYATGTGNSAAITAGALQLHAAGVTADWMKQGMDFSDVPMDVSNILGQWAARDQVTVRSGQGTPTPG